MGQGLRVLIREKACGEEIDAILASSQPFRRSLLWLEGEPCEPPCEPLLTRNLPMYCYNCYEQCRFTLAVSAPRGEQLPPSKARYPACIVTVGVNCVCLLPFGPLITRVSRGPTGTQSISTSHPPFDASRSMLAAAPGLFIFGLDSR